MHISQINLDGLDLRNADYRFTVQGLWSFEKDIVTNDLLGDGMAYERAKNKSKTPVLSGFVKSADAGKMMTLNAVLARNGLKQLTVTTRELGALTCAVEVTNRGKGDTSRAVSCQLTMPDPCLYAFEAGSVQLGSLSNAALVLPAALPWTLGSITGGEGTVTNIGNADAYPIITIIGTCSAITVMNETTGECIGINASLSDSHELVIDCSAGPNNTRGVYLNGVQRLELKQNAAWIHCPPGDNVFKFTRNSLQNKKHCTVALRSRWI